MSIVSEHELAPGLSTAGAERSCAYHIFAPALAICSDCGQDICGPCHGMDLRGFAVCQQCRLKYGPIGTPWEAEGTRWTPGAFARTLVEVISAPRTFFMRLHPSVQSWMPAAAFGMTCIAIGIFFNTLWQALFIEQFGELIAKFSNDFGISPQLAQWTIFASIPLAATFSFVFHVLLLHGALKMIGVTQAHLPLTIRIAGYASAAYLFLIIPTLGAFSLGHFLMIIWLFNLEVSAVRWFFGLSFWRSIAVVLVPFVFILLMGGA